MSETITLRQWVTLDKSDSERVELWEKLPTLNNRIFEDEDDDAPLELSGVLRQHYINTLNLKPGDCVPVTVTTRVERREEAKPRFSVLGCGTHLAVIDATTSLNHAMFLTEHRADAEEYAAKLNERDKKGGA